MSPDLNRVFAALRKYGLLLLNDPSLPSVCSLVTGERVRGSWWTHPRAQAIFNIHNALEDHIDVLIMKLVSGKVTYIHRKLWSQVIVIGSAREPWQMKGLAAGAKKLLMAVDRAPVEPGRKVSTAASELEARMLVFSAQFHSESGAHVRRLESWQHWSCRAGASPAVLSGATARASLEELVTYLNQKFHGMGRLPWQSDVS